jgi:hypothetical protein
VREWPLGGSRRGGGAGGGGEGQADRGAVHGAFTLDVVIELQTE